MGAVLACSAVTEERVVPAAFLVAEVLPAVRADSRVAADYLEAGPVSRGDSLADSRVLVGLLGCRGGCGFSAGCLVSGGFETFGFGCSGVFGSAAGRG